MLYVCMISSISLHTVHVIRILLWSNERGEIKIHERETIFSCFYWEVAETKMGGGWGESVV